MGASLKRNRVNHQPDPVNGTFNHPYTYPPDDGGDYFTTYFHLGTRKFDAAKPDSFLFGDLSDINYLTHTPSAFPYKQPLRKKPIECLTSYINLHKDTVKLTRCDGESDTFMIEFLYDSEFPCKFSFLYHLPDVTTMDTFMTSTTYSPNGVVRGPQSCKLQEGLEQKFSDPTVKLSPYEWEEEMLSYDIESDQRTYPVTILMETTNPDDGRYQSLMTICNIDKTADKSFSLKVLKQKLSVEGMEYVLHEVFGLENKAQPKAEGETNDGNDDDSEGDIDEFGAECVVCYTDVKDTILLPCRHFCLCSSCAGDLRYQASNCPICRAPFQAIVQLQGLQEVRDDAIDDDEITNNPQIYSIAGYRSMSILQAINGYPKLRLAANSDNTAPVVIEVAEEPVNTANGDTVINIGSSDLVLEVSADDDGVLPADSKSKDLSETQPSCDEGVANIDEGMASTGVTNINEGVANMGVSNINVGVANGPVVVMASIESTSRSSSISEYSHTSRDSLIRRSAPDSTPTSYTTSTSVDSMTSLINNDSP